MSFPAHFIENVSDKTTHALLLLRLDEIDLLIAHQKTTGLSPLTRAVAKFVVALRRVLNVDTTGMRHGFSMTVDLVAALRGLVLIGADAGPYFSDAYRTLVIYGLTIETASEDPVLAASESIRFVTATARAATRIIDLL